MLARSPRYSRLFALVVTLASPLAALAQGGAPAAQALPETTISVTGTGRVDRAPDFVDVSVGIESLDKAAAPAQARSESVMKATIAAIGALALAGQELQTGTVELSPRYESHQYSDDPRKIVGYVATITIRIRTTDLNAVARIIDAALGAGANRIDWVQFGIKEAIAAREEAIKLATHAAQRKARTMADALDLRLGRVIDAGTSAQQYGRGRYQMTNMAQQVSNEAQAPADAQAAIVPGKVEVWAEVSLKFAAVERK
jgi:uncharacterized protein YggE